MFKSSYPELNEIFETTIQRMRQDNAESRAGVKADLDEVYTNTVLRLRSIPCPGKTT